MSSVNVCLLAIAASASHTAISSPAAVPAPVSAVRPWIVESVGMVAFLRDEEHAAARFDEQVPACGLDDEVRDGRAHPAVGTRGFAETADVAPHQPTSFMV